MVIRNIDAIAAGLFVGLVTVTLLIVIPLLARSCTAPDPVPVARTAK